MAQFADYGFNRSHSVAYAYLAYQTAYLKAHYPAYFYASVLSHEAQDSAKVYKYSSELRSMGLKLLPPDINESDDDFTPLDDAVRYGLTAIKGMGAASVSAIIEARKKGSFKSLFDFTSRLDQGSIGKRGLESLITAGAFDSIKPENETLNSWRARLFAGTEGSLIHSQKTWNDKLRGQNALFAVDTSGETIFDGQLPDVPAWSQAELSRQEKASVGFYLSAHPLDDFKNILADLKIRNIADFEELKPGDNILVAGIVSGSQIKYSKKGNRFCILRLEDRSGGVKCLAWAEAFAKYSDYLKDDELLIVDGKVESNEGQEITLIVNEVKKIADAFPLKARRLVIDLPAKLIDETYFEELFSTLSKSQGRCEVLLQYEVGGVALQMHSQPLRIQGSSGLEKELIGKGCRVQWIL
jgi:DNA polymerase-3 subunit alpha